MPPAEIEVPKELREFMPEGAQETLLGYPKGARRQYRYGNLHIREYDDKFLVHVDRIDPLKNPAGHLVREAPEILAGLACGIAGGIYAARRTSGGGIKSAAAVLSSSAATGYLGYAAAKRIKEYLE